MKRSQRGVGWGSTPRDVKTRDDGGTLLAGSEATGKPQPIYDSPHPLGT